LNEAGLYTKKEAENIARIRGTDIPVPAATARAEAGAHVSVGRLRTLRKEGQIPSKDDFE
jgi:hypothetical protein